MSWWEGYEEELLLCSKAVEKHSNEFSPPEKLFNILKEERWACMNLKCSDSASPEPLLQFLHWDFKW